MTDPKGVRFVVVQFVLLAVVGAGPWIWDGWSPAPWVRALGALSIVAGLGLAVAAGARLGRSLTPLPVPVAEGALVREGVYRHARHPIYGGVLLASVGWTVATGSWASLAATAALWMTFEAKSRFEELWLARRYPAYEAYARGTRRFVPFLY